MIKTEQRPVALVTGASRGIGRAIAVRFAQQGFAVAVNHSGEHSAQVARDLAAWLEGEYGVEAAAFQANVAEFDQAKDLVAAVLERFGRLDVLVNNAGVTKDGLLMRMKEQDFDSVLDVNLKGAFNCMRHAVKPMMKQRSGSIVNLSSIVGVRGNAGQVNYAASKAGIIGMTKAAAKELASRNITVNAVAPGFIQTDMTADLLEGAGEDGLTSRIGLGRVGTPEDVAEAVCFLAGPTAGYITGQVLAVDGGVLL